MGCGGGIAAAVVDMHQLDARPAPEGPEHQAANAAEAIDANFQGGHQNVGQNLDQ